MATTTSPGAQPRRAGRHPRGNVGGSVVVGNDNIVVNGVNGSIFIGRSADPCRAVDAPPPKAPDPFVGRTAERRR